MLEDNWSWKRFYMICIMMVSGMITAVICGCLSKLTPGSRIALGFSSALFLIIFVLGMEIYRLKKGWFHEKANNYVRIAISHGVCCVATIIFLCLPSYVAPVMLMAVGMTIVTNSSLGMLAGIFYCVIWNISKGGGVYQFLWAVVLLVCGAMIVEFLKEKENQKWVAMVIAIFTLGCTVVFSYLDTGKINTNMISYGVCNGIITAGLTVILYRWLTERMSHTSEQTLERIISEDFSLVQVMRNFSKADYRHARKVSDIARECAKEVGADPFVAAAGGFYYRIGRMEGKPYVENGVLLAKSNYFPMQVVQILSEYNGEKALPTTVESAIVHIVDSVVAKFDVLDKNTLSNSWNQDILVYQTLNENSAAGLYDKAGFSMNMFLKIRDYLIKEAKLL